MLGLLYTIINNFLNHVFHAIWFYLFTTEPRHSKKTTVMLTVLSALLAEGISLFSFAYFDSKQTALTFTFYVASVTYAFFYIFLMQGGKKLKSLFFYFTYIGIWAAVYVVVMILTRTVLGGWQPAMWILRSLFNIVFLIIYRYYLKEHILRSQHAIEKACGVLILISGMAYLLLPTLMIYYAYGTQTTMSLVAIIFLLLFSMVVYFFIFRFIKQLGRENDLQAIQMRNKYLEETVKHFETIEREAKRARHDHKHHNLMLLEYAKNGDTEAIIAYLHEYEQYEQKKTERLCANRTADAILRSYLSKAEQKDIHMQIDAKLNAEISIKDIDMVAILANMLENAIHGCETAKGEKSIEVSIHQQGFKLILQCKNTCDGNIRFENGIPKRRTGEGVGVQSILTSAERYNGDAQFSLADGMFTCCVILNDMK